MAIWTRVLTSLRPLPAALARPLSVLVLLAWAAQMYLLVDRAYLQAATGSLASDLGRYGNTASWKGVYYRGEKIGFSVGQTVATADGFELQEDGRLQMTLLGATTAAKLHSVAVVDKSFRLRSFVFSLDPGTGGLEVSGTVDGKKLSLTIKTKAGTRSEVRELSEPPALNLNLPRRLAAEGLTAGKIIEVAVFDPTLLRNSAMKIEVLQREVVSAGLRPTPAFKLRQTFNGMTSLAWVTDTGEVVREESPTGLIVVKQTRATATALAVPGNMQADMLQAAAIVPRHARKIDDPMTLERLRVRIEDVTLPEPKSDMQGGGQYLDGDVIEVRDSRTIAPVPLDPGAAEFLKPESFIESDAPEIVAEAEKAVAGVATVKAKAERLTRYVNALLEKRPTVSLPSAREVLRTRVGDCNEHTTLYVAMARALGLPARIAVGVVYLHGAFYYHAWPEVYVAEPGTKLGQWMPVDPTLNQFPADATHIRFARGGLEKQAAIMPLIGTAKMEILDAQTRAGAVPILVGRPAADTSPLDLAIPSRDGSGARCWSSPRRR